MRTKSRLTLDPLNVTKTKLKMRQILKMTSKILHNNINMMNWTPVTQAL